MATKGAGAKAKRGDEGADAPLDLSLCSNAGVADRGENPDAAVQERPVSRVPSGRSGQGFDSEHPLAPIPAYEVVKSCLLNRLQKVDALSP